mmetsp:Transcript_17419/g.26205  ORF Transcript_17419/g.26205 Transcript_17419/m.26205 type:complete len:228 (+) Transcript_17419:39-722(+)
MPKSKRVKKVTLSKVKKKEPSEKRSGYVEGLRECVEKKNSVYLISVGSGTRNRQFKSLRSALPSNSRLFLGKKTLMQLALGTTVGSELRPNLSKLAVRIEGNMALLVSDEPQQSIKAILESARSTEFATAGFVPETAMTLEKGPLDPVRFPGSMFAQIQKLGLTVQVIDAQLTLLSDFVLAKPGSPLTPEQAKLLKHMDIQLDIFQPSILCAWHHNDGEGNLVFPST